MPEHPQRTLRPFDLSLRTRRAPPARRSPAPSRWIPGVAAGLLTMLGAIGVAQPSVAQAAQPTQADPAQQGQLLDRIVAVVNDGVVLESDVDSLTTQITGRLRAQNVTLPPDDVLRKQVLDQLVTEEIESQRATREGVKVSDEQVNAALAQIAKQQNISFDELPERLAQDNVDYAYYRDQLRREIGREILQQQEVMQRIVVTPRELDQYIANQQNTASGLYEYDASNILLAIAQDASPAQLAHASALAHDIDDRAKHGEDFAKLAVAYSQAGNALQGGELGWRKGTELPTFLADAIARLKPGGVGDVIQTPTGFHIVKLNARRAAGGQQIVQQVHLRHILLKPTELVDNATVQQKLERMREQIVSGKEDFAVLARTNSQDPGSAVNGGDLGWTELSAYVPAFSAEAASLKPGEISQPFHTQFGWHIVQLLGHRDFDNTGDAARERAYESLRDSRVDEATELWVQQLKDGAYVKLQL